jgi:predicted O-methyltransferase YrrM
VRNLHYHDPSSIILLYNGSENPQLIQNLLPFQAYNVVFHPQPKPQKHGYLHGFALDCMQYSLDNFSFDTFTIVDSDQLCIREGYSSFLSDYFAYAPNVGLLSSVPERVTPDHKSNTTALQAFREYDLWKPFLDGFTEGDAKFVHWTFWPSTVFTFSALRDLVKLFAENQLLQHIMQNTKIWATEEVIFPTLVRLLGYEIAENPCSYAYVKYKQEFTRADMDKALQLRNAFWVHPIERRLNNPLRQYLREGFKHYALENPSLTNPINPLTPSFPTANFIQNMRQIEGWLSDGEATLLLAVAEKALSILPTPHHIVEVGSYHGKSTVLLGSFIKAYFPKTLIHAIDPHDGKLGAADKGLQTFPPSLEKFKYNIERAGLADSVVTINSVSTEVLWHEPICFLFIDGLHDYANVAKDFRHFSSWITEGGYVAFHDYADYFPDVKAFVHELIARGKYAKISLIDTLMIVKKLDSTYK